MDRKIYKQTIVLSTGEITTYFEKNSDGSFIIYTPEASFIIDWLSEGNTTEEWIPEETE